MDKNKFLALSAAPLKQPPVGDYPLLLRQREPLSSSQILEARAQTENATQRRVVLGGCVSLHFFPSRSGQWVNKNKGLSIGYPPVYCMLYE